MLSEVLSEYLNLYNNTNNYIGIKYVLSHTSYQHVLIAFVNIIRVAILIFLYRLNDFACWALMNLICSIFKH